MNREDLDETRVMPKQDMGDTMELPPVRDEQPAGGQTGHTVRRLTPESPQGRAGTEMPYGREPLGGGRAPVQPTSKRFWTAKRKKAALLVGGFVVMLFLGFMVAGYQQAKNLEAEQQRIEQQQLKDNQKKMAGQVSDLQQQKADLQRQIRELEARQAELEKEQKKNAVERFFDKVTGKGSITGSGSTSGTTGSVKGTDAATLQQQVDAAKSQAEAIDQKIDTAKAIGQQAAEVKDKAVETYKQNEGVIHEALGYAKAGAQALFNMLK